MMSGFVDEKSVRPLAFFAGICYRIIVMVIFARRYKYGQEKRFALVQ